MNKHILNTQNAPAPIGPYSQAVVSNNMLFISGQIALDPTTGQLMMDSIAVETNQVMNNLNAVLSAAGLTFRHVVKTSIFLSDMAHFGEVNEIYGSYFTEHFPARETVAVKELPRKVNVEISMIATF